MNGKDKQTDNKNNPLFIRRSSPFINNTNSYETKIEDVNTCDKCGCDKDTNTKSSSNGNIEEETLNRKNTETDLQRDVATLLSHSPDSGRDSLPSSGCRTPDVYGLFTASSYRTPSAGSASSGAQQLSADEGSSDSHKTDPVIPPRRKKSLSNQVNEILSETSTSAVKLRGRIRRHIGKKKIRQDSDVITGNDVTKAENLYPVQILPADYTPYNKSDVDNEDCGNIEVKENRSITKKPIIRVIDCKDSDFEEI